MRTTVLGRTGLTLSRLGLGLAALGRPGYINLAHAEDLRGNYDVAAMEKHTHAVLDAAWAAGIRYLDVARSYGLAEQFLGTWLSARKISRAQVVVGSKWGYTYTANWQARAAVHEVKEHSLAVLRRQWQESRSLLNGFLDLYQIHSVTLESGVLQDQAVLEELDRLKSDGVRIGLTLSGPGQGETLYRAMDVQIAGTNLFEVVEATWNLLEPSAGPALAEAKAGGMGILIKEALANGRLTERNHEPEFAPKLALLRAEAARRRTSVDALALAACLAQPFADTVLSGAATVAQLQSNVQADSVQLDADTLARLSTLAEPKESYWNFRKKLSWN